MADLEVLKGWGAHVACSRQDWECSCEAQRTVSEGRGLAWVTMGERGAGLTCGGDPGLPPLPPPAAMFNQQQQLQQQQLQQLQQQQLQQQQQMLQQLLQQSPPQAPLPMAVSR